MAVVASAPGKVLMTGGYLVLERPNAGLVLSTNARFFAIVKPLYEDVKPDSWAWAWADVKLTSPQLSRESLYKLGLKNFTIERDSSRQVYVIISLVESRNPFVEQAVQYAVTAAHATFDKNKKEWLHKLLLQGLDITILGANEFYSYRNQIEARGLPLTPEALATLPAFTLITFNIGDSNAENCKPEVAKTGLGSSAAMTTAVVAALLHYLGVVNLSSIEDQHQEMKGPTDLDVVHMIAQTAHCIAQGKVGSGFDVSSAVYGSQRYVRFSPEVISSAQIAAKGLSLQEVIVDILKGEWDHERTKFSLPPLMTLLLGEPGTGGSSTPSMVGAVKKWQKSDPQKSLDTWTKLSMANSSLEVQLNMLSKLAEEHWGAYQCIINSCSRLRSDKWLEQASEPNQKAVVKALLGARDAMLGIRYHMRQMGEAAGVPVLIPGSVMALSYPLEVLQLIFVLAEAKLLECNQCMIATIYPSLPTSSLTRNTEHSRLGLVTCPILVSIDCSQEDIQQGFGSDGSREDQGIYAKINVQLHNFRQTNKSSQVIEPESQTQLLDATMNMEGVLLAGVPGAGGFDAIFAVTLGDSGSNVTKMWSSVNVLALLVREDPRGVSLEKEDPRTTGITAAVSSVHIE
ncbi:putative phosphomevalonate kinase [Morella rubra]|uniref:phosphomevalonate kinase n=1 Tax=Morella rubra TaxID=262757 RepID=A0A6A1WUF5_9ROSI|nr:putative phosphomevalonate kinase [Morella rubra]